MKLGRVFVTLACASFSLAFLCFRSSAQMAPTTHEVALRIIVAGDESAAHDTLERLAKGEDFGALAKEKSVDPTGQVGGYTGLLDPSSLRAELREALQGLAPGKLSKIVHIPEGYAILEIVPSSQTAASENAARNGPAVLSALQGPGAIRFTPDVSGIIGSAIGASAIRQAARMGTGS